MRDEGDGEAQFREALARLLRERGFTLRSFAEHLSATTELAVSHGAIQNWTSEDVPSKPWQTFAIERALDLPAGSLSRLLGYLPLDAAPAVAPEDAIANDPTLRDDARRLLLAALRAARDSQGR